MNSGAWAVEILSQGEAWVAVAKPSGLAVVPTRDDRDGPTVQRVVQAQLGERLWVVHRLDQDTSGVLLLARNAVAHRELCGRFERREVKKTYLALCRRAQPDAPTAGRIDRALEADRRGGVRVARVGGKKAGTRFRVLSLEGDLGVIEARPKTGRRHQLRVHLAAVGWPLAVDPRYGSAAPLVRGDDRCERLTLHAWKLDLPCGDARETSIVCPPPSDLAPFLPLP